ncbi:hypothetical protein PCE31107_04088 [Pandoraea cepalis]|uniref:Uncharacterized protein n=1 Tax=Pandoraea cepalis TaxID=2508294 RepID=A0A5E4XT64_9BURK|nr:hypothetical protein PCE31107_04088 [Pandoraea cepalis]
MDGTVGAIRDVAWRGSDNSLTLAWALLWPSEGAA